VQGGGGGGFGFDIGVGAGGGGRKSPCAAFGSSLYNGQADEEANVPGREIGMRRPFNSASKA